MGRIKEWWKKKRGRVRTIAKAIGIGVGIGSLLSLAPWWAGALAGGVLVAANPAVGGTRIGTPAVALPIGIIAPWAGVGTAILAPALGPALGASVAGSAVAGAAVAGVSLHRGMLHSGKWGSTFLMGMGTGLILGSLFD